MLSRRYDRSQADPLPRSRRVCLLEAPRTKYLLDAGFLVVEFYPTTTE